MKIKHSATVAFICILLSCHTAPAKKSIDTNIQSIIATCITATIGKGDTARYYYKLMPPQMNGTKRYNDSMMRLLDTAAVYLVVQDTLGNISKEDKTELGKYIEQYKDDYDESKHFLIPQKEEGNQSIDLSVLEKEIGLPVKKTEQGINDELRITGSFHFSRIFFNVAKTGCVVYLNFFATRHAGYGEIFQLEKTSTGWKVSKRGRTWVS